MHSTISASILHHVIDAIDRLKNARKNAVALIIKRIEGDDVRDTLDKAIIETKKAGNKLARLHPDSDGLPIQKWIAFIEFAIDADARRKKRPDMSRRELATWARKTVAKITKHASEIDAEIGQARKLLCKGGNENPRDKYIYERLTKGDTLKTIRTAINAREGWYPIDTVQGIYQAAERFATKHGRPWPPR
jgi:hypothetical protein